MAHLWLQVLPVNVTPNSVDPRLQLEEAWMHNRVNKIPTDEVSLYNYAAALTGEGKFTEAVSAFERLLALDSKDERRALHWVWHSLARASGARPSKLFATC